MASSSFDPQFSDPEIAAKRLIQKAHNRDGLPEMAVGVSLLLFAGLLAVESHLNKGTTAFKMVSLVAVFAIVAICSALPWMVKKLRQTYLIGIEGFVEPKPVPRSRIAVALLIAFGIAAIAALLAGEAHFRFPDQWMIAGTGLFMALIWSFGGRFRRFVLSGIAMGAVGVLLSLSPRPLDFNFAVLFSFAGLLTAISGVVVLLRFLRLVAEREGAHGR